jgi:RNA polymerase sigma factor (sigma-70 family)
MVVAAGDSDHPSSREALAQLCGVYWPPVYSYIRHRGYGAEDSRDLAQEFFARLLDKRYLKAANRERGRFRTYLLTAVQHFLANEHDRATAQKRGSGQPLVSLDLDQAEARCRIDPADDANPERAFERRWALTLLEHVLDRLGDEMTEAGQAERFAACRTFLAGDAFDESGRDNTVAVEASYKTIAARLGISEGAVKVTVHRMRKRYGALLRDAVTQTLGTATGPEEAADRVDAEVRHLLTIVGR